NRLFLRPFAIVAMPSWSKYERLPKMFRGNRCPSWAPGQKKRSTMISRSEYTTRTCPAGGGEPFPNLCGGNRVQGVLSGVTQGKPQVAPAGPLGIPLG